MHHFPEHKFSSLMLATSNEGKQNEGEKQVFLYVSTEICHLTHFTGLA
jgi:hypothetical protein